jgi:hypothetical protein
MSESITSANDGLTPIQENNSAIATPHFAINDGSVPDQHFPRFPGETPRAYGAFITFFDLCHGRSLTAVAEKSGEGLATVKNWSSKYSWSKRIQDFNSGVLQHQADSGITRTLFIHTRCSQLLNCLRYLQHDPDSPADILKINPDEEGLGGDDPADALRYLVATKLPTVQCVRLRGF